MIHPQYSGSDGELLWHVYYGDFSDDERFDGFRRNELWDANVIRPILQMDDKFEQYAMAKKNKRNKAAKVLAHDSNIRVGSNSQNYAMWLVILVVALSFVACAYGRKLGDSKVLKQVEAMSLLQSNRTKIDEHGCYVY